PPTPSRRHPCGQAASFPTSAPRRSLALLSVPIWPAILPDQLPVAALVGHYPANKLIGREAPRRRNLAAAFLTQGCPRMRICGITRPLGRLSPTVGQVPHVLRTRLPLNWSCPQSRATCMC